MPPAFWKRFVKIAAIGAATGLLAGEAAAVSQYTSTNLSCGEVQAKIKAEGRVFLQWRGDNKPVYKVFISHRRLCRPDEGTELTYVPTSDRKSCPVRQCVDPARVQQRRDRGSCGADAIHADAGPTGSGGFRC